MTNGHIFIRKQVFIIDIRSPKVSTILREGHI